MVTEQSIEQVLDPLTLSRAVVSTAFAAIDPAKASRVTQDSRWAQNFGSHLLSLDTAIAHQPLSYPAIANEGLRAAHDLVAPSLATLDVDRAKHFETLTVHGTCEPVRQLTVPYRGRMLRGQELLDTVGGWVERGLMAPSVLTSIDRVIKHPEWLHLEGDTVVILGATAKTGAFWPLMRWGANVVAVDLPSQGINANIRFRTLESAGTAYLPVSPPDKEPGVDLFDDVAGVARWIESFPGRIVLVDNLRSEQGSMFQLAIETDRLIAHLLQARPDTALGFYGSPADSFAVHTNDVLRSRAAFAGKPRKLAGIAQALTHGSALRPNYPQAMPVPVFDGHMGQHSWDFTLAKRIQRWRAVTAAKQGHTVSSNIAPPTIGSAKLSPTLARLVTRSASKFGIEPFEVRTSVALMAALLVHDLRATSPTPPKATDWEYGNAVHAGFWTGPYKPSSVMGLISGKRVDADSLHFDEDD